MKVGYLKENGIMCLVRNSQNLLTLHLCPNAIDVESMKNFDAKTFWHRKFTFGIYMIDVERIGCQSDVLWKQRTDHLPILTDHSTSYTIVIGFLCYWCDDIVVTNGDIAGNILQLNPCIRTQLSRKVYKNALIGRYLGCFKCL